MGDVVGLRAELLPRLPGRWESLPLWQDFQLARRQVLVREDFNVPLTPAGDISDDSRLLAGLPGLQMIVAANAAVRVVSHLGRPQPGEFQPELSMLPVARWFSERLCTNVPLLPSGWHHADEKLPPGSICICENMRFIEGENDDDDALAESLAGLCDVYINDAFAVSHRQHASVHGITRHVAQSCVGPLMYQEIKNLARIMEQPQRPLVAIIGGAKLESKMGILKSLLKNVDTLIITGGIANTIMAAKGLRVGKSLTGVSSKALQLAQSLVDSKYAAKLMLPCDVVCADKIAADATPCSCELDDIKDDHIILDIGPKSRARIAAVLGTAGTIIWSGPPGLFELPAFAAGSRSIVESIAASNAFSVVGGGDTLAAVSLFGGQNDISYLSTGGSAFLYFLETGSLPALDAMLAPASMDYGRTFRE